VRPQTGAPTAHVRSLFVLEPKEVPDEDAADAPARNARAAARRLRLAVRDRSTIERHQHHTEQPAATAKSGESGGESGPEGGTTHVEKSHGEAGVKILGVDTESLALTNVRALAPNSVSMPPI
jgi:hypothetical protein